jgi:hypothetical protein
MSGQFRAMSILRRNGALQPNKAALYPHLIKNKSYGVVASSVTQDYPLEV